MLTIASILPLAPLYLEMEGLKTSSNSRLTAMNCHRCPDLGTHHGQGMIRLYVVIAAFAGFTTNVMDYL